MSEEVVLLIDLAAKRHITIRELEQENARLLEIIKEYKMATTGLIDYMKLRDLNEGKEE